jgi:hypothetical protein
MMSGLIVAQGVIITHADVNVALRGHHNTVIFGQQTRLRAGVLLYDEKLDRFHADHVWSNSRRHCSGDRQSLNLACYFSPFLRLPRYFSLTFFKGHSASIWQGL